MSRKNISRNKVSRRLKHPIAHKEITRNVKPGYRSNSGMPRNQMTIYGMKLSEKQKVRYKYDLKDQHVKKYVQEAVKNKKMDTLDSLCKSLECNVAVAVWRLIGGSIRLSKQLVNHGHVLLNNKKVILSHHQL
ncbi:MAG: helix-turn-helix domain-containing protein [Pseudomonadota bacterium]